MKKVKKETLKLMRKYLQIDLTGYLVHVHLMKFAVCSPLSRIYIIPSNIFLTMKRNRETLQHLIDYNTTIRYRHHRSANKINK